MSLTETKPLNAKVWAREPNEHYVEPHWCSKRLFEEEMFSDLGTVWDPCCGFGRIPDAAMNAGYLAVGTDKFDRGYANFGGVCDFLETNRNEAEAIVCNPPFNIAQHFAEHALSLPSWEKIAMVFPTARLNAAHWIKGTPLARIWLMTPRPSMPPGYTIAAGEKPGGGKMDFCWLVWDRAHEGDAVVKWLRRDA